MHSKQKKNVLLNESAKKECISWAALIGLRLKSGASAGDADDDWCALLMEVFLLSV